MGFQAPRKEAIERRISDAFTRVRKSIEEAYELVEDLKVDIADSGNPVTAAGAEAFAEDVLGVPAGNDLGQSGPWAATLVDSNAAASNLKTTLDANLTKIRRIVYQER